MRNVLVSSKNGTLPQGLEHAGEHRLILDSTPGWALSSNALLHRAAALGGDALFLDDDVTLTETSLIGVSAHYADADIFGLDLHDMSGARQAGARHILTETGALEDWIHPGPAYVAHCSTSAIYFKADVVRSSVRFPIWDGIHWEDVAFCLDAWLHGFRVMAVPGRVNHAIVGGVGATKRHDPQFWQRWMANKQAFEAWGRGRDLSKVPMGVKEL